MEATPISEGFNNLLEPPKGYCNTTRDYGKHPGCSWCSWAADCEEASESSSAGLYQDYLEPVSTVGPAVPFTEEFVRKRDQGNIKKHRKWSNAQVLDIRKRIARGESYSAVGRLYNTHRTYIQQVAQGKLRLDVGGPITRRKQVFVVVEEPYS